ncbi:MAG: histone deacetylase family protein [Geminicoccaceae bacterium]
MLPIVHHPDYTAPMPSGHRFPMDKFRRVMQRLLTEGIVRSEQVHRPEPASRSQLLTVHGEAYVDAILNQTLTSDLVRRIGLPITPAVARRAVAATGGTLLTARLALNHGLACNTAGGSHHGFADYGSGFCVFNDVATAAAILLQEGSIERVLVVDLDVHQGDGTAKIFEGEPAVFTFSIHCRTNFPARKQESDLDIALEPGIGDETYLRILADSLPDLLSQHRPDLVFFNAGVDPHHRDKLGRLALSDTGLHDREHFVLTTCLRQAIPVAGVLGGGYVEDLDHLANLHTILHQTATNVLPGLG